MENWIILVVIAVIVIIWLVKIYNTLVSYKTQYENSFAQILVQLKRRVDLIGNLVDAAKAYMQHEKGTLDAVTKARAGMIAATKDATGPNNTTMATLASSQIALDNAVGGFNMRMEAYPDLKASSNIMQLSEEMTTTENRISSARQAYNDLVQKFNEYKKSFPNLLFANLFGFSENAKDLKFSESVIELNKAPKNLFK